MYGMETVGVSAQGQAISTEIKFNFLSETTRPILIGPQSDMVDESLRSTKSETPVGMVEQSSNSSIGCWVEKDEEAGRNMCEISKQSWQKMLQRVLST